VILGNITRMQGQGKHATQIALSQITKVDPMTTSQALRTLERKKLIRRVVSKEDRRAVHVLPTPKGVRTTELALDRFIKAHVAFFGRIDTNLDGFTAVLQELVSAHNEAANRHK
jgi:DNA-binding MarR family transcriptional regulator